MGHVRILFSNDYRLIRFSVIWNISCQIQTESVAFLFRIHVQFSRCSFLFCNSVSPWLTMSKGFASKNGIFFQAFFQTISVLFSTSVLGRQLLASENYVLTVQAPEVIIAFKTSEVPLLLSRRCMDANSHHTVTHAALNVDEKRGAACSKYQQVSYIECIA